MILCTGFSNKINEKKAKEIAIALGKKHKAVESLLHRAKQVLKKEMESLSDAFS